MKIKNNFKSESRHKTKDYLDGWYDALSDLSNTLADQPFEFRSVIVDKAISYVKSKVKKDGNV